MNVVTTTFHGGVSIKPFAWSYSKLKNFEVCPKRHFEVDIAKSVREEESEHLSYGNAVHTALAGRIAGGRALPPGMEALEKWCARVLGDGAPQAATILVEQKLAIKKDFTACTWFAKDTWFRGVADVLKIQGPVALAIDWKTGKILEDGVQLALMAACIFAHHEAVQKIRTEFIWLKEDATSRVDFAREDMAKMWQGVWPRIAQLEHAHSTQSYPAKPGRLCRRWCPVTACEHHGE